MFEEEKKIWVKFACAALIGLSTPDVIHDIPDECDDAARYADEMLHRFHEKFENC